MIKIYPTTRQIFCSFTEDAAVDPLQQLTEEFQNIIKVTRPHNGLRENIFDLHRLIEGRLGESDQNGNGQKMAKKV